MSEQTTTTETVAPTELDEDGQPIATALEQALAAGRKAKNKLGKCECAAWEVGQTIDGEDGEEPEVTIETTGCDRETKRLFAQGHDAKLKSLFIRAGVEGLEVRYGRAAGILVTTDAEAAARRFGFGEQVQKAILSRLDKLARSKKAIPAAPRTVGAEVAEGSQEGDAFDLMDRAADELGDEAPDSGIPQAPADQDAWDGQDEVDELLDAVTGAQPEPQGPELIEAKVGRWPYKGRVAADGAFLYKNSQGEDAVAPKGKWTAI